MKTWYATHIILDVQFQDEVQTHFPAWENVVLLEADSDDEAYAKAEAHRRTRIKGTFIFFGHQKR